MYLSTYLSTSVLKYLV